ncbi:unnamed protein product, partial [Laminaria digitata]
ATEEAPPPPPRVDEASTSIGNTMAETSDPISRVELLCMSGGQSATRLTEVTTSRSTTKHEPTQKCGIERRPQSDANSSSQNGACEGLRDQNRSKGGISAAGSPWYPIGLRWLGRPRSQKVSQEQERRQGNDTAGGGTLSMDDDPVITAAAAAAAAVAKSQPVAPVTPCSSSVTRKVGCR